MIGIDIQNDLKWDNDDSGSKGFEDNRGEIDLQTPLRKNWAAAWIRADVSEASGLDA
eukprot:SAG31_NODE_407_length_16049_cov_46.312915_11_plen_57_part_00